MTPFLLELEEGNEVHVVYYNYNVPSYSLIIIDGDIEVIKETDSLSGQILYKSPKLGKPWARDTNFCLHAVLIIISYHWSQIRNLLGNTFNVWASGYAVEGIGVLAYVALNGSHCLSKYQWYQDESIIQDEVFPVIYVTQCGIYKCKLSFFDIHVHELEFVLSEGWCIGFYII